MEELSLPSCSSPYELVFVWPRISALTCFTSLLNVLICVYFLFSGGRNILVTGSNFDIIQTAVMMVQGENFTVTEVPESILFLFPLFIAIIPSIFHSAH